VAGDASRCSGRRHVGDADQLRTALENTVLGSQVWPQENFRFGSVHHQGKLAVRNDDSFDLGIGVGRLGLFWVAVPLLGQGLCGGAVIPGVLQKRIDREGRIGGVSVEWRAVA